MRDELSDRYGEIPASASNLLLIAVIRSKAHKIGITEIKGGIEAGVSGGTSSWKTVMTVYPKADIHVDAIQPLIDSFGGALKLTVHNSPEFVWRVTKRKYANAGEYLEGLLDMVDIMENTLLG